MPKITIPLMDDEDLAGYLQLQLREDKDGRRGNFASALDLDVSYIDARATMDGVLVTCVEFEGDVALVSYAVDYSIFSGCSDLHVEETLEYCIKGTRTPDGWEFMRHVPFPTRSTADEL